MSFEKIKQQTFRKWTAIYFVNKLVKENIRYAEDQQNMGYNIKLVNHTGSVGRNYEVGIIKHCPQKSFIVVLRRQ